MFLTIKVGQLVNGWIHSSFKLLHSYTEKGETQTVIVFFPKMAKQITKQTSVSNGFDFSILLN